ncbi:MAG: uncharacterized protein QOJ29_1735, partial [Thermoleophilaceae bacterium]|nr:uncharacterized protein [Thermoleophilaceae bacterium]
PQIKVPGIESSGISFTEPLEVRGRPAQLLLPNTKPPYPAVVMLGGGQGQAEFLAAHGIAALTYQERGSLADAQAALAALRARSDIRRDGVGVWALGEAANEAAQLRGAAAIVAMSPVVVPRADARDWRVRRALDAKATPVTNWLRLRARGDQADPARAWRQVAQPVLAIWGTEDDQVPIRASAEALRGALEAAPNKDRTFRWFVTGHAGTAPGLLEETARWLGLHLGAKRARPLVRASLPPTNGRPDPVDVTNASALYSAPIQIAWLLLPALLLGFAARTRVAIAPAIAALACTAAIAGGIAMALHSDGRIATVVGTPWPFALAFAFAGALAAVTIAYVGRRAFVPAVASAVWLALALFWLL